MPMDPEKLNRLQQLLTNKLREHFGPAIFDVKNALGEITVEVDRGQILPICRMLRVDPDFQFEFASYITAVDYLRLNRTPRFDTVYNLLSLHHKHRVRVRAGIPEDDPTIDSVFPIWKTANFHEREVYDMFGIVFKGHPDLRRILMPDDWEGFPLRKEFPLGGVKSFYFKRSTEPRAGEPAGLVPRIREQKSDI